MTDNKVTRHYARGDLADAVIAALVAAGNDLTIWRPTRCAGASPGPGSSR